MKIVIIDNYDSFTYNLAHLVRELGVEVAVYRNDQFEIDDLEAFDRIILSPGPGIPSEAGLLLEVIRHHAGRKPMLGVCLGHQAIGEVFGASLINLSDVFHGVSTGCRLLDANDSVAQSPVTGAGRPLNSSVEFASVQPPADSQPCQSTTALSATMRRDYIFEGLPQRITVGRYHSWVVSRENFPSCLEITALSDEGQIMALRHRDYDIHGIQFHPESVLTPDGKSIIGAWLSHKV